MSAMLQTIGLVVALIVETGVGDADAGVGDDTGRVVAMAADCDVECVTMGTVTDGDDDILEIAGDNVTKVAGDDTRTTVDEEKDSDDCAMAIDDDGDGDIVAAGGGIDRGENTKGTEVDGDGVEAAGGRIDWDEEITGTEVDGENDDVGDDGATGIDDDGDGDIVAAGGGIDRGEDTKGTEADGDGIVTADGRTDWDGETTGTEVDGGNDEVGAGIEVVWTDDTVAAVIGAGFVVPMRTTRNRRR